MSQTKLKTLKLANTIQVGARSELFFRDNEYDIILQDNFYITVSNARRPDEMCMTTVMNVIWFVPEKPATEPKAKRAMRI